VKGGTVYNIIPPEVKLTGTVRTFDSSVQNLAQKRLKEIAKMTAKTFGAESEFKYIKGYPTVVNNPDMTDFVLEVVKKVLGEDRIKAFNPVMGGEDFAYFLQKLPGAFLFFGMGDGMEFPHHHPAFDIDERALPEATLLMTNIALEYLKY